MSSMERNQRAEQGNSGRLLRAEDEKNKYHTLVGDEHGCGGEVLTRRMESVAKRSPEPQTALPELLPRTTGDLS